VTEAEWRACDDPLEMLDFLSNRVCERKAWLLVCGFARLWGARHPRGLPRAAVDALERYADGGATPKEVTAAVRGPDGGGHRTLANPWHEATVLTRTNRRKRRFSSHAVAVIRDVVGNPFRPAPVIDPAWLAWSGGTVRKLAAASYEERAFDRLPVLADALEDAGCSDPEVLGHLHCGGEHARGCWVLDLLLGKS
jgi:hypothetical protein